MNRFIYFLWIFILLGLASQLSAQNSNFEGIIKYVPLHPTGMPGDTLIVYFGKQKIRTSRLGTLSEKFGGVTEEITHFAVAPNETVVYFGTKQASQIIKSIKSGIDSVVTYPDSSRIILGYRCIKSIIYATPSAHSGTHRIIDTIWSATDLSYLTPKTASILPWHPDYSSGGIPLLRTRMVYSELPDGSQYITSSTMIACSVLACSLPDNIFIIP